MISQEDDDETMSHATDEDVATGIASISSMPSTGLETPDTIDLRKRSGSVTERPLYQVLEQQDASVGAGNLMGSSHTYVIPGMAFGGRFFLFFFIIFPKFLCA